VQPDGGATAAGGSVDGPVVDAGPADRGERPIYARWWPYAAVSVAAGGVALFYSLKLLQAEDDFKELNAMTDLERFPDHMITFADALAIEDRGKGYARNANIAWVVTGVFAAVSGGLLIHQLVTDREPDEEAPAVGAALVPGGGGAVNLTLGF